MRAATIVCAAITVLATALPGGAGATPRSDQQEPGNEAAKAAARALFEEGQNLYREGWFCEAFRKFDESHEKFSNKKILWNMAMCQLRMGHRDEALGLVDLYLIESGRLREAPPMVEVLRVLREAPADVPDCDIRSLAEKLVAADREAEAWLKQAAELVDKARKLEIDGEFDTAAGLLEESCQIEASDACLSVLTRVYIGAGKRDAAIGALDRFLEVIGEGDRRQTALLVVREALEAEEESIPPDRREGLVTELVDACAL